MIIVLDGGDRLAREHAAYILTGWAVNELGVADADVRADPPTDAALKYQTVTAGYLREDGQGARDVAEAVGLLLRPGVRYGDAWPYGGLDLPIVFGDAPTTAAAAPAYTPAPDPVPATEGGADHGL